MSLAPREKRVLAGIEDALRGTDPELAAMLARFAVPAWWKIRHLELRRRLTKLCVTAVFFAITTTGLVLWGLLSIPVHQQQCAAQRQGLPGLTFGACAPAHSGSASGSHPSRR